MMSHSRAIFSDELSLQQVAEHWVRKSTYALQRGVEFRKKQSTQDRFLDIQYDELVENASGILEQIYRGQGGIKAELMEKFKQAEQENPPQKYGTHQYSLDDFGLTKSDIEKRIKAYREFIIHNP
jgi:hypothetical protein